MNCVSFSVLALVENNFYIFGTTASNEDRKTTGLEKLISLDKSTSLQGIREHFENNFDVFAFHNLRILSEDFQNR